mmetsp:Transcript_36380/g.71579  ORF Transcript_36380/g.71579 Transcript_36380/m.71579 type:complete len:658 (-) Transcript_36380:2-1975(-)
MTFVPFVRMNLDSQMDQSMPSGCSLSSASYKQSALYPMRNDVDSLHSSPQETELTEVSTAFKPTTALSHGLLPPRIVGGGIDSNEIEKYVHHNIENLIASDIEQRDDEEELERDCHEDAHDGHFHIGSNNDKYDKSAVKHISSSIPYLFLCASLYDSVYRQLLQTDDAQLMYSPHHPRPQCDSLYPSVYQALLKTNHQCDRSLLAYPSIHRDVQKTDADPSQNAVVVEEERRYVEASPNNEETSPEQMEEAGKARFDQEFRKGICSAIQAITSTYVHTEAPQAAEGIGVGSDVPLTGLQAAGEFSAKHHDAFSSSSCWSEGSHLSDLTHETAPTAGHATHPKKIGDTEVHTLFQMEWHDFDLPPFLPFDGDAHPHPTKESPSTSFAQDEISLLTGSVSFESLGASISSGPSTNSSSNRSPAFQKLPAAASVLSLATPAPPNRRKRKRQRPSKIEPAETPSVSYAAPASPQITPCLRSGEGGRHESDGVVPIQKTKRHKVKSKTWKQRLFAPVTNRRATGKHARDHFHYKKYGSDMSSVDTDRVQQRATSGAGRACTVRNDGTRFRTGVHHAGTVVRHTRKQGRAAAPVDGGTGRHAVAPGAAPSSPSATGRGRRSSEPRRSTRKWRRRDLLSRIVIFFRGPLALKHSDLRSLLDSST